MNRSDGLVRTGELGGLGARGVRAGDSRGSVRFGPVWVARVSCFNWLLCVVSFLVLGCGDVLLCLSDLICLIECITPHD